MTPLLAIIILLVVDVVAVGMIAEPDGCGDWISCMLFGAIFLVIICAALFGLYKFAIWLWSVSAIAETISPIWNWLTTPL